MPLHLGKIEANYTFADFNADLCDSKVPGGGGDRTLRAGGGGKGGGGGGCCQDSHILQ